MWYIEVQPWGVIVFTVTRKKDLEAHETSCPYRPVSCPHCNLFFESAKLQNHLSDCDMLPITCVQCNGSIKRTEFELHMQKECPESVIACPFSESGCKEKVGILWLYLSKERSC
jgi:phage FluMu protein Com